MISNCMTFPVQYTVSTPYHMILYTYSTVSYKLEGLCILVMVVSYIVGAHTFAQGQFLHMISNLMNLTPQLGG